MSMRSAYVSSNLAIWVNPIQANSKPLLQFPVSTLGLWGAQQGFQPVSNLPKLEADPSW